MKTASRVLIASLAAAVALPLAVHAAKGDRKGKKDQTPAVAFATVDKDNDGSVTETEFVAAMKDTLGESAAKTRFATLDKDSNGKLTKEEYAAGSAEPKKKRKKKDAN